MSVFDFRTLKQGFEKIKGNPQLWLTVFVALSIFVSFVYIANSFAGIARDAQDRLVNVRIGSLQDAFVPLAALFIDDTPTLRGHMQSLAAQNPTIVEFLVAQQKENGWIITSALEERQLQTNLVGYDFLLSLAVADPTNSFTVEEVQGGERYFRTARAVVNTEGAIIGVALTRQTLSEADRQIGASIQNSFLVLIAILILLLFLFFHHARIIDYTDLYKRLKEVDQLKDDFVSMVSHELRSPLTIVRGYVSEMREGSIKPADYPSALQRIDESAQTLNFLVGDILDVARIEQGRMAFSLKSVDPSTVISSIVEGLQGTAQAKGLSITSTVPSGVTISVDEDRLRQIVTNLVSNAIKYSDKGTISITATTEAKQFTFRVSDTGIGMTAEELQKLFGKFYRVSGDRVRKEIGTGLGLWITKQLVEAMKGKISVESIKGVGSHFIVSFPIGSA
jgi:signal transduction histidine kinase